MVDRLRHSGLRRAFADLRADSIIHAIGDHWPAVVQPGADNVDLVPALRPMLVRPQRAGLRMQRSSLRVSIAERVLLRFPSRLADERVARRNAPIIVQANDRAGVIVRFLRSFHLPAITERDVQVSRSVEYEARSEMPSGISLRLLAKDYLDAFQPVASELAARDLGTNAIGTTRSVGKVNPAGFREARMKRNVHQAS